MMLDLDIPNVKSCPIICFCLELRLYTNNVIVLFLEIIDSVIGLLGTLRVPIFQYFNIFEDYPIFDIISFRCHNTICDIYRFTIMGSISR